VKLKSQGESETKTIGRRIGSRLKKGDIVCLYGELGSGKTTLVKGIASALGIQEKDITSASFTIITEYETPVPFYHIDLYRISDDEIDGLGLEEYLESQGICVIEWAERAGSLIPEGAIKVFLRGIDESTREIEIKGIEI
jgi:tRNA threonylcarbamoyladenosine biosynthesis protein TsaE